WIYIGTQGILQGTYETFAELARRHFAGSLAGRLTVTAGLGGMGGRDPATRAGGQRARAALMRALLARPRAILLDEPFASLDAGLRAEMRAFTFERIRAEGIPALLVTHDAEDAAAAGGPVLTLAPA
ncbi:MAG: hypothetical protein ACO3FX_10830, partial [Gemmobacter sp.]